MLFIIFLFITLIILLAAAIVGQSIANLLPYRLRSVGKFYFSPLFGVGIFVLIATVNAWITPFNQWVSIFELLLVMVISLFFSRKDFKFSSFSKYSALLFAFALIASVAISSSLIRFNGYNPFDDTFTYLVHGQWLQTHAFSQRISSSGFYPALSQIVLYQRAGSRMGGSFFLGWLQSIFGLQWSYYAYPAAIAIPFISGSLAIGGAINFIARGSRKIALLTSLAAATMFSGMTFGVTNGFFPQTFGLAFAVGGISLYQALIQESRRTKQFKRLLINAIPISIFFAVLVFSYNDMLPFVVLALIIFLILALIFDRFNFKGILLTSLVVIFQTILIINLELIRILQNVYKILFGVGSGVYAIGYPILWNPFEFLAFSFGFRTAYADYWILGKYLAPLVFGILFLAIMYYLFLAFKERLTSPLLIHVSILLVYFVTFLYFRYASKAVHLNEIGHTFLQFKMAKWASPFAFVIMGSAIAFYMKKYQTKILPAFLIFLILFSVAAHIDFSKNLSHGFRLETGYDKSPFKALLDLKKKVNQIDANKIIYLNFGPDHHKLRQMISYVLSDRKLASDYTDDGYIAGHLPPEQRKIPMDKADLVMEFANPSDSKNDARIGNIVLKEASEVQDFTQISVSGGYSRETDGKNWWYWTPKSLFFEYFVLKKYVNVKKIKLKFTYLSLVPGTILKIKVGGEEVAEFKMVKQWHDFVSGSIDVNDNKLLIEFTSDGKPVRASDADPRMVSFLLQNLELVKVQ